jgi:putative Mg2+ transporter-C (MgtC) family protein
MYLELQILAYVGAAMILGALIGFERELADKPAGVRTHMLVGGTAALLVQLGDVWVQRMVDGAGASMIQSDPIRIVEAIVAGVAFLGAGTIIRGRDSSGVQGLTTAAALFFTSAVGVGVGLKEVVLASGATLMALGTLRLVRSIEERLKEKVRSGS